MMHDADPQLELGQFFGALSTVVETEREGRHGRTAALRQEVRDFFCGLASEVEAKEEIRLQAGLQEELGKFLFELNQVARTEEERRGTAAADLTRDLAGMFGLLEPTIAATTVALKIMEEREGEERDRRTGRRFSTFDLVRTQELDLSRIFGELMNPAGTHSQGDLFLSLLFEELNVATTLDAVSRAVDPLRNFRPPGGQGTVVHIEYATDWVTTSKGKEKQGSVDLVLQFDDNRWIGIENKPWASDQEEQVNRYLSFLDKQAVERHQEPSQEIDPTRVILLYWSGDGSDPDWKGVSDEQKQRCLTVPYRGERFGPPSVEGWIRRCYAECEAERVRVFLRELIEYIEHRF